MKNGFLQTTEGKAFVKMALWLIFIGALLVIFSFRNNDNNNENKTTSEEVKSFRSIEEMENDLLKKSLNYKYVINDNENIIIYDGMKCNEEEVWFKETSEGITKYLKENDKVYKVILEEKEEYTEEESNLESLFNYLKEYSYNEVKNNEERNIKYNLGTLEVDIKTNFDNIVSISVLKDGVHYEMQFTNIGICDNINLSK